MEEKKIEVIVNQPFVRKEVVHKIGDVINMTETEFKILTEKKNIKLSRKASGK